MHPDKRKLAALPTVTIMDHFKKPAAFNNSHDRIQKSNLHNYGSAQATHFRQNYIVECKKK